MENAHGSTPRLVILFIVVMGLAFGAPAPVKAHVINPGPGAPVVGFDMVSDAANTGTNLGTINRCVEVANVPGTQFVVDAWIDAIPNDLNLDGYNFNFNFPDTAAKMVAQNNGLMIVGGTDISENATAATPDTISPHGVTVANLGSGTTAPGGTRGVLGRYTMQVRPAAANGLYNFSFDLTPGLFSFPDPSGSDWWYGPDGAVGGGDDRGADIWDGNHVPVYGRLALGMTCPTEGTYGDVKGTVNFGLDMTSDTQNTSSAMGAIDRCLTIPNTPGTAFDADSFIDVVPPGEDLDAFGYRLDFPDTAIKLAGQGHGFILPQAEDISDNIPDLSSPHSSNVVNLNESDPTAGAGSLGVLGRYTFEVLATAQIGYYQFKLSKAAPLLTFANSTGQDWSSQIELILDGDLVPKWGVLALGVPCPGLLDLDDLSYQVGGYSPTRADLNGDTVVRDIPVNQDVGLSLLDVTYNHGPFDAGSAALTVTGTPGPEVELSVTALAGDECFLNGQPASCTGLVTTAPNTLAIRRSIASPIGLNVNTSINFNLRCLVPSTHSVQFSKVLSSPSEFFPDLTLQNNSGSITATVDCVSPADLQMLTLNPVGLSDTDSDGDFDLIIPPGENHSLNIQETIRNNGVYSPVSAIAATTIPVPVGCQGTLVGGPGTSVVVSTASDTSLQRTLNLSCTRPGSKFFTVSASVAATDPHIPDFAQSNNGGLFTVEVKVYADVDGDGYWNADENLKGSDPSDAFSTPEHCDGADNDGDTVIDEPPIGGNWDQDADGIKDCNDASIDTDGDTLANPDDADDDGDDYSDIVERYLSTDELAKCPAAPGSHDASPLDNNADNAWNVLDVLKYKGLMPTAAGSPSFGRRLDLDANGTLNVVDILNFKMKIPSICN